MVVAVVAVVVALMLAAQVMYLVAERKKYRKKEADRAALLNKYLSGVKESVKNEVLVQREMLDLIYSTCDNFQRHQAAIADKIAQLFDEGAFHALCANIEHLANIAENGALYRMAEEYSLTELELRTCCFIYFGFKWQEICTSESISENAYNVRCSRIRKKLGLSKEEKIPAFISEYCRNINSSEQ